MSTDPWHADINNLIDLAEHLNDSAFFDSPADVICFFEKPWKFTEEWEHYFAANEGRPDLAVQDQT